MQSLAILAFALPAIADPSHRGPELEVVARLDQSVGNVTFTPENRVFFSYHPFFNPSIRVAELLPNGTTRPYPNLQWNTPRPGTDQYIDSVLGLRGDENGIVWLLDAGTRTGITPKVVGWDTRRERLHKVLYIPRPSSLAVSFIQDLVVDVKREKIYLADESIGPGGDGSQAALIVLDVRTGVSRRVLTGHESVLPLHEPIRNNGNDLVTRNADGTQSYLTVGADGIAADRALEWLYFAPLTSRKLWRVRVADLIDERLDEKELAARVEYYAEKPFSGGFSIDAKGDLYLTNVSKNTVGVIAPSDRVYRDYATAPELHWPDGVSYSPDGHYYVSAAQIDLAPWAWNGAKAQNGPPYLIFRFKGLAPGRVGH